MFAVLESGAYVLRAHGRLQLRFLDERAHLLAQLNAHGLRDPSTLIIIQGTFVTIQGTFLTIQETFGENSGNIQGTFRLQLALPDERAHLLAQLDAYGLLATFVTIQGTFREHSGNIQGTFGEHSGNIQGTFREHSDSNLHFLRNTHTSSHSWMHTACS